MEYIRKEIGLENAHLNIVCKKYEAVKIIALIKEIETSEANLNIGCVSESLWGLCKTGTTEIHKIFKTKERAIDELSRLHEAYAKVDLTVDEIIISE